MLSRIVKVGESLYVECLRTERGIGLVGLNINLIIKRSSDSYYWSGSGWLAGETVLSMSEYDSSLFPGLYTYTGPTVSNDTYIARSYISSGEYEFTRSEIIYGRDYAIKGDQMDIVDSPSSTAISAIQNGLLKLSTPIENQTVEYVMKCVMAMFNGDFTYNQNAKTITFKDRSGVAFSVVSVPDDNTRTRIS